MIEMKRIIFILFIGFPGLLPAQNVRYSWAERWDEGSTQSVNSSIVTDVNGNIFIARYFNLSNGIAEIFVSKLDAAGNLIWENKIVGGPGTSTVSGDGISIGVDALGNVYVSGFFYGSIDFDAGIGVSSLSSNGSIFLLKLNAAGLFSWVRQLQTIIAGLTDRLLAVDPGGDVYMTGSFKGTVDFDPGPGIFNLTSGGGGASREIFISKFNTTGDLIWAKQMGGQNPTDGGNGFSIELDLAGNIYATGNFYGTVDFDPGASVLNLQTANAAGEGFISKLDGQGNLIWAKQIQGAGSSFGQSISVDGSGNVYTLGSFLGSVDFDPGAGVFTQTSGPNESVFISKLDASGNFVWANQLSGSEYMGGWGLAVDGAGNSFITGSYFGTINFDPNDCAFRLSSVGYDDIFISKLDPGGNFSWVKTLGGIGSDEGLSVALDADGDVYTTGSFERTVDFDPGIGVSNLSVADGYGVFLQKMSPCNNSTSSIITATACGSYTLNCKTYTSSGNYTQLLTNVAGCDSNITLNLTISNNKNSITNIPLQACDNYLWKGQSLTASGIYSDTLVAANGCDSIVNLQLTILQKSTADISDSICEGQSYGGYTKSGTYIDTLLSVTGCDSIRTLHLSVQQKPAPSLGEGKGICTGDTLMLSPGDYSSYLWQDGSTLSHFIVNQVGSYAVTVSNLCGQGSATISVTHKVCNILFPSAFTPNGDGKNETFRILNVPVLYNYTLTVFNRWGQKVFETRDYTKGWDGSFSGGVAAGGVYVWFCQFKKAGDAGYTDMKGTVLLVR
jgi:gliding motility-associated-like protein